MNDINAEDSLRHCKSCGKVFDLNDYDGDDLDTQDYCSSQCKSEAEQEWADLRREEFEYEALHDKYPEEKNPDNLNDEAR